MEKDAIEKLFERMTHELDIYEPDAGHEMRFLKKLEKQQNTFSLTDKRSVFVKGISIAASIAVLVGVFFAGSLVNSNTEAELASVSPQLEETQDFFTATIAMQLEKIEDLSSAETQDLVDGALKQMKQLEADYKKLKEDLVTSNNDKRVISAMITNFQKRASLLEEVLEKMNTVKNYNLRNDENQIL